MNVHYTLADGTKASIHVKHDVTEDRACLIASRTLNRAGVVGFNIYAVSPA
ncbi:hypothetical protein SEA_THYATIRA_87 [Mycobacterium phage Thyatira]|uniref:Uncharacterized protein n=1 Tax=Mycobacterium phage Thyatira TaxID=2283261 RepID=A0A345M9B4_9CAUD|nr:hypothetical protein I5G76_gp14 [Mycobacterium phage Thyatira]AXH67085.1 hypothetical protein SEA_THYATIRA_87 [Mycobacterium phage Thyatira]